MNRVELKAIVQANLGDVGVSFYSDEDLNDSIKDAYDEVTSLYGLRIKESVISLAANTSYVNVVSQVPDYIGGIVVYDPLLKRCLNDDVMWPSDFRTKLSGTPTAWAPVDSEQIVFLGRPATERFYELTHFSSAPELIDDSSEISVSRVIVPIMEEYIYGDLLEQFNEFTKAGMRWEKYFSMIEMSMSKLQSAAQSAVRSKLGA